jgi:hypothetical protein
MTRGGAAVMTRREERIAFNEALFRQVNERLEESLTDMGDHSASIEIFCECGQGECMEKIRVGRDVYEQVRQHPARFLVAPGHDAPDVDRVIETLDTFQIVEKHPEEAVIARATDPRA